MWHAIALSTMLLLSGGLAEHNDGTLPVQPPLLPVEQMQSTPPAPGSDVRSGEPQLGRQMLHTFLALGIIVALLYIIGRVILPRFLNAAQRASGKGIRVVERTMLDQKHVLYVVDVEGAGRMVLGASDGEIRLLASFSSPEDATVRYPNAKTASPSSFASHLFRPSSQSENADTKPHGGHEVTHGTPR